MNMFLLQIEFDYTIPLTNHFIIYIAISVCIVVIEKKYKSRNILNFQLIIF